MKRLTRAEQKALRPTQILEAAFEEFVERGFATSRVEDIAERVGVTKGTIYVYFPTKEELFSAMIRYIAIPLDDLVAESRELEGNSAERLTALLVLLYKRLLEEKRLRQLLRFVISEGTRFPQVIATHHDDLIAPVLTRIQAILDEGVANGEFVKRRGASAAIVFAPLVAIAVETLVHGESRELDVPDFMEAHLDFVMGALLVRSSNN